MGPSQSGKIEIPDSGMIEVTVNKQTFQVDPVAENNAIARIAEPIRSRIPEGETNEDRLAENNDQITAAVAEYVRQTHNVSMGSYAIVAYMEQIGQQAERVADFFTMTPASPSGSMSTPVDFHPPAEPDTSPISEG